METFNNRTSSYPLTTQVISESIWTPEVVEKRQKDLVETFVSKWNLKSESKASESPDFMIAGRGGDAVGYPLDGDNFIVKKGSRNFKYYRWPAARVYQFKRKADFNRNY